MSELRKPGVWTPRAAVLCFDCHGPKIRNKTIEGGQWLELCADQPPQPNQAGTHCDKCGTEIWVRDDVAWLRELCYRLGGEMQQTGGMCAGARFAGPEGIVIFVSALDGPFIIGVYPNEEAIFEGDCYEQFDVDEGKLDQAAELIGRLIREADYG